MPFSSLIVGNIKSLSVKKTLSHFERVKSFEEEVARLTVNNWLGSALVWEAV